MENTFGIPIIPANEKERLEKVLHLKASEAYNKSGDFQHIAAMAAHLFKVPIALVTFVEEEQVSFRANVGMEGVDSASRGISLCSLAILKDEVTVFENAADEPCLLSNPLVRGSFGLKFYAAAPLKSSDGFNIGAVCIVDKKPRKFSESDRIFLKGLAAEVMAELEEKGEI